MESPGITLARAAYSRYGAVTDYKNFQGNPMPEWEQLPAKIQEAWVAAANPVTEPKEAVYSQYQTTVKPTALQAAVLQCCEIRWDGDIESKRARSEAADLGYIARVDGFNIITKAGITHLLESNLIHP